VESHLLASYLTEVAHRREGATTVGKNPPKTRGGKGTKGKRQASENQGWGGETTRKEGLAKKKAKSTSWVERRDPPTVKVR